MRKEIKLHPFRDNKTALDLSIFLEEKENNFILSFTFPLFHHVNNNLTKNYSQWGLWNHDVFEIFMQKRDASNNHDAPYTEFQISPLGQFFILEILKKRERYYTPLEQPFLFQTSLNENWQGSIQFPKEKDFDYYFNFSAIQGPSESRNHFASCGDYISAADFHCPHLFKKYF